jgi:hypothetical protein
LGFKIDYPHARRSYSDSGFGDDDDDQLELSKTFGELNDKKCKSYEVEFVDVL